MTADRSSLVTKNTVVSDALPDSTLWRLRVSVLVGKSRQHSKVSKASANSSDLLTGNLHKVQTPHYNKLSPHCSFQLHDRERISVSEHRVLLKAYRSIK